MDSLVDVRSGKDFQRPEWQCWCGLKGGRLNNRPIRRVYKGRSLLIWISGGNSIITLVSDEDSNLAPSSKC